MSRRAVSPHTPTRGVTLYITRGIGPLDRFNPHSNAGSDLTGAKKRPRRGSFNPHSHAGSDTNGIRASSGVYVSIHTPTRGVTPLPGIYVSIDGVSICI